MHAAASAVALAALAGSAAAFTTPFAGKAVAGAVRCSTALRMADLSKIVGSGAPLGTFDPLGIGAKASDAELLRHAESEIKHGRIAMLAIAGFAIQEVFHPFFPTDTTSALSIDHPKLVLDAYAWFWALVVWGTSLHEFDNIKKTYKPASADQKPYTELLPGRVPGDLGFDPLDLGKKSDPAYYKGMQMKEINNGRLAMLAVFGAAAQELVTGKPIFGQ